MIWCVNCIGSISKCDHNCNNLLLIYDFWNPYIAEFNFDAKYDVDDDNCDFSCSENCLDAIVEDNNAHI